MRNPARCVAGHLIWDFYGGIWGLWRIDPPTYARLSEADKLAWHDAVTGTLLSISTESMILGLSRPVQPGAVADAMASGVNLAIRPEWGDVVHRARATLEAHRLPERCHYLAIKLPTTGGKNGARRAWASAVARIGQQFRIASMPVPAAEVAAARIQATELAKPLARLLGTSRMTAATSAEAEYVYARAFRRGTESEPTLGDYEGAPDAVEGRDLHRHPRLVAAADIALVEGGDETDAERPRHRRYVRVDTDEPGYQTFLCFAHVPHEWIYPGGKGECLPRIGDLGFPLDWCLRIRPTPNIAAQRTIQGQIRQLSGQYEEYDGDLAGAPDSLTEAIDTLRSQLGELGASPSTPELQVTFVVGIGAPNLRVLEERRAAVRTTLGANEHELHSPTGDQRALWGAMMPGSPLPAVCNDYTQYMSPAGLAGTAPFTGTALGDPIGGLLGLSLDGGGQPVLFDAAYGPAMAPKDGGPRSGSVGIFGKLGSGKSQTAKRIMWEILARGGQVIVTDRTAMHEYGKLADVMPGTDQIVRLADGGICLDPLRVFTGDAAVRYTIGFLTLLTHTVPTSAAGALLAEAVRAVHMDGGCLTDVVKLLEHSTKPRAADLAELLSVYTRGVGLAQVAFGEGEPLRLDGDYIVFDVPQLDLPPREMLASETLVKRLMPEQIFSQALLYLITAISGEATFADRRRFSMVVIDEGYALTASPEGEQLLLRVGKDGRKHNGALMFISHLPTEMPPAIADLLGARFLFRMARNSAKEGLAFLGMDASPDLVDTIAEENRNAGECLFADRFGRIGLVKVLQPHTRELEQAFNTGLHHFAEEDAAAEAGANDQTVFVEPPASRRHLEPVSAGPRRRPRVSRP